CHPPFGKRNLGALEDGANRDGKLALAVVAVQQSGAMRLLFAADAGNLLSAAAVNTNRAIGPADRLKRLASCVFVSEHRMGEGGHEYFLSIFSYCRPLPGAGFSSFITPL